MVISVFFQLCQRKGLPLKLLYKCENRYTLQLLTFTHPAVVSEVPHKTKGFKADVNKAKVNNKAIYLPNKNAYTVYTQYVRQPENYQGKCLAEQK